MGRGKWRYRKQPEGPMAESNPFVAYPPVGYPNRFKMVLIALLP